MRPCAGGPRRGLLERRTDPQQRRRHFAERVEQFGRQLQRAGEASGRLGEPPLRQQHRAAVVVGGGEVRLERDRALAKPHRLCRPALSLVEVAEFEKDRGIVRRRRGGVVRVREQRALEGALGLGELALRRQRTAEIVVDRGGVRRKLRRATKSLRRLIELALRKERAAEIVVGAAVAGIEADRLPVGGDRRLEAAERVQRHGDVVVIVGIAGARRERPIQQIDGGVVASGLLHDQTTQVQACGVARIGGEDAQTKRIGLVRSTRPMMLERLREQRVAGGRTAAAIAFLRGPAFLSIHATLRNDVSGR